MKTRSRYITWAMLAALSLPLMGAESTGCGSSGFAWGDTPRPPAYDDDRITQAEGQLIEHDIRGAQRSYTDVLSDGDSTATSTAAAGSGLTQLMLLPGASSTRQVLYDRLGADNTGYDAQALFWEDEGILYWLSRGTRWEDDGEFQGVQSLVAELLPWSSERLRSLDAFCEGLESTPTDVFVAMEEVNGSVASIEASLLEAAKAPDFDYFYVPAQVFHDDSLSLALGRSELYAIAGALAIGRGVVHFLAAYEVEATLDSMCGPGVAAIVSNPDDPAHVPEFTLVDDYAFATLDAQMLRSAPDQDRLDLSRAAIGIGLERLQESLRLALLDGESLPTSFDTSSTDVAEITDAITMLNALRLSLDGPTALPGSEPRTELDLSVLFDQGMVLEQGVPLLVRGEEGGWSLSDQAFQTLFVDRAFEPTYDAATETGPSVGGDPFATFDALTSQTFARFDELYFSTL